MGLLDLFIAASIPVLKVLLITALGSYLALDHVNILSEDARKHINNVSSFFSYFGCVTLFHKWSDCDHFIGVLFECKQVAFYVFNPALVSSSLAGTITYESMVKL